MAFLILFMLLITVYSFIWFWITQILTYEIANYFRLPRRLHKLFFFYLSLIITCFLLYLNENSWLFTN